MHYDTYGGGARIILVVVSTRRFYTQEQCPFASLAAGLARKGRRAHNASAAARHNTAAHTTDKRLVIPQFAYSKRHACCGRYHQCYRNRAQVL